MPIYVGIAVNSLAYGYSALANWRERLGRTLLTLLHATSVVVLFVFYAWASRDYSRLVFGVGSLASGALLIGEVSRFRRPVPRSFGSTFRSELVIVSGCQAPRSHRRASSKPGAQDRRTNPRNPMMLDRLGREVAGLDYTLVCYRPEDREGWSMRLKGTDVPAGIFMPELSTMSRGGAVNVHGNLVVQVTSGPLDLHSGTMKRLL